MGRISRARHSTFVFTVSAQQSCLEVPNLDPFPIANQQFDLKIVAIDHHGTPLKQRGDQFTASVTINGQPQVGLVFPFLFHLNTADCFVFC